VDAAPARAPNGEPKLVEGDAGAIEYFALGAGPPVVLLASYARAASDFNELADALTAGGYRTLAINARGIGRSDLGPPTAGYHDFARDVLAVLDAERIAAPALVIGHAYGNRVARTFAADHPERARALVLIAAGGETRTPEEVAQRIPRIVFGESSRELQRQDVGAAFFASTSEVPEHWIDGWHPAAGELQGRATAAARNDGWQTGGSAPILLIQPAEDRAAPAGDGGHPLALRHPRRVTYVELPRAGHAALPERGERIAQLVLDFFAHHRRLRGGSESATHPGSRQGRDGPKK
jgi:pimeloyl-ACP methyl ester carboxylesterase